MVAILYPSRILVKFLQVKMTHFSPFLLKLLILKLGTFLLTKFDPFHSLGFLAHEYTVKTALVEIGIPSGIKVI